MAKRKEETDENGPFACSGHAETSLDPGHDEADGSFFGGRGEAGSLVNLADGGGNAYLRVGLTLRVADAADKGNEKTKDEKSGDSKSGKDADAAAVRDTALAVLGRQTSESLLATDGKERLKAELKTAIAEHNRELKVTDLFFTEFLVQR